jgi:DNA polymerase III alpha subunit
LACTLEARRLGIGFLSPDVNASRKEFRAVDRDGKACLRVPLWKVKDVTETTLVRIAIEVRQRPFSSLADFYRRVVPAKSEAQNLIRVGAFDSFGDSRTKQFWHLQQLADWPQEGEQGILFAATDRPLAVPDLPLDEPTITDRLIAERDLLGFTVSGHPLDLFPDVDWKRFCPIVDLGKYCGKQVTVCGLSFADRIAYQVDGKPMKFVSLCDYTGFVETELFAETYRQYGMETIKSPLLIASGTVEPFTLRVLRVAAPPRGS